MVSIFYNFQAPLPFDLFESFIQTQVLNFHRALDSFQIDGDTDSSSVQKEFEQEVRQHVENLGGNDIRTNGDVIGNGNIGSLFNQNSGRTQNHRREHSGEYIEDLEDSMPGAIPTISNQVSNHVALTNGHIGGKHTQPRASGGQNGHVPNGRPNLRTMLEDAEMDSHI